MFGNKAPAKKALQEHVQQAGTDPRAWTPEQKATHSKLVTASQQEQLGPHAQGGTR